MLQRQARRLSPLQLCTAAARKKRQLEGGRQRATTSRAEACAWGWLVVFIGRGIFFNWELFIRSVHFYRPQRVGGALCMWISDGSRHVKVGRGVRHRLGACLVKGTQTQAYKQKRERHQLQCTSRCSE